MLQAFSVEPAVAVDTESNSLHAYQEQVCLIQFSIPSADYLVDPLANMDLSPLGELFANPEINKVFHAAEYDVMCLKRDYNYCFENLFDTMWAARILGWPRVGLGNILKETFNVRTHKRYQRYNWGKRPLESGALAYACTDTHYLLSLCQLELDALIQQGRVEEAREAFSEVAASKPVFRSFSPDDFWRVKGMRDLSRREKAIVRELCIWRDQQAFQQNRPHFKVLNDHILVALAQANPSTEAEILDAGILKSHHMRRYGTAIMQAIEQGKTAELPQRPARNRRRPDAEVARFQALRVWRKQTAENRGVESDIIVSNNTMWALAEHNPRTLDALERVKELGAWKCKTYGEAILKVLRRET